MRADRTAEYEQAHAAVPIELIDAIRAAGVTSWTIWRSGTDLFHVIDCADYAALLAALAEHPVNVAWQATMAELLVTAHDYSGDGPAAALRPQLASIALRFLVLRTAKDQEAGRGAYRRGDRQDQADDHLWSRAARREAATRS